VWRRQFPRTLPRHLRSFAWRLAHGAVGCNARRLHFMPPVAVESAMCSHPACLAAGGAEGLETWTHALVTCPAVRPVIEWALDLFALVAGGAKPPADARLLIADDHRVWAPPADLEATWALLRVVLLSKVWAARCRRQHGGPAFTATGVAAAVVHELRRLIDIDWRRASSDVRDGSGFGREWFAGRNPGLSLEQFARRWAGGGALCAVLLDNQGQRQLDVRLTLQHPVLAPGMADAGPGPATEGAAAEDDLLDLWPVD
jgi:hypothetical protein